MAAGAVVAQLAILGQNPVAGDDDGNGVAADGRSDRSDGLGMSTLFGQFAVTDGGSQRHFEEGIPNIHLKQCSMW